MMKFLRAVMSGTLCTFYFVVVVGLCIITGDKINTLFLPNVVFVELE